MAAILDTEKPKKNVPTRKPRRTIRNEHYEENKKNNIRKDQEITVKKEIIGLTSESCEARQVMRYLSTFWRNQKIEHTERKLFSTNAARDRR